MCLRRRADRLVFQGDLGAEAADWVGVATVLALLFKFDGLSYRSRHPRPSIFVALLIRLVASWKSNVFSRPEVVINPGRIDKDTICELPRGW